MKIILITKVANLGQVGDVVSVSDGYGKNFLIPQKKAIFYNVANYAIFEEKKHQFEAENQANSSEAESNKGKLLGKNIIIIGNASDDGRLYGSVTTANIASRVNEILGVTSKSKSSVSRSDIILKKPIKDVGVYDIKVDLYSGIVVDIKILVGRSESEVETLLAAHLASKTEEVKPVKKSKIDTNDLILEEQIPEEIAEAN